MNHPRRRVCVKPFEGGIHDLTLDLVQVSELFKRPSLSSHSRPGWGEHSRNISVLQVSIYRPQRQPMANRSCAAGDNILGIKSCPHIRAASRFSIRWARERHCRMGQKLDLAQNTEQLAGWFEGLAPKRKLSLAAKAELVANLAKARAARAAKRAAATADAC
jgi:hypothetical protein